MSSDADTLTLALSFVTIDGKRDREDEPRDNPKRVAIEHPSPYSQMEVLPEGYSRRDSGSKNKPIIIDSDSDSDSETPVTFRQDYFSWGPFLKKNTIRDVYRDAGLFELSDWRNSITLIAQNKVIPNINLDDTLQEAFGNTNTIVMKWAQTPQRATAVHGDP